MSKGPYQHLSRPPATGKMVCTGTKSEQEARTASRKYAKILQKLGYAVSFKVGFR